jgi:immune inhibitor A
MGHASESHLLAGIARIYAAARASDDGQRCCVAPHPDLQYKINQELERLRKRASEGVRSMLRLRAETRVGFNDGLIIPGDLLPLGSPPSVARAVALERAPLRGTLRVIVILVDFSDKSIGQNHGQQHFRDLFFSTGVLPNGSVREYYTEATNGLITIAGEVVGPYRMPRTMAAYAHGESGTGATEPNARTMALDAAKAANPDVNFGLYDNDGNGFVDAFIVVHAGPGAEVTGNANDIWSHKWVLSGGAFNADGTQIYPYLTVPEDARIGVCAHELGHLLFGFPDLYDTDYSSSGIGNFCLMAGGSWGGGGDIPTHPSAWCKANQGWASVVNQTSNQTVTIDDVKSSHQIYRLWKDGGSSTEYFLVENRQKTLYDRELPGDGLLIWHVDESIGGNSDEHHPKVALIQADGKKQLESGANRGDAGDPYPGSTTNTTFNASSNPNSRSYAGNDTCVAVTNIGASGAAMAARLTVSCGKDLSKDFKDTKDVRKEKSEAKEWRKDKLEAKDVIKDKERWEKDPRLEKPVIDKRVEKPVTDKRAGFDKDPRTEKLTEGRFGAPAAQSGYPGLEDLEARVGALEQAVAGLEPFIGGDLRPDLRQGALAEEGDLEQLHAQMLEGDAQAKRLMDGRLPPRR